MLISPLAAPIINTAPTIDFSIIDTIIGAIIAVCAMLVVGFFIVRYKIFIPGWSQPQSSLSRSSESELKTDRDIRRADRQEIKEEIKDALSGIQKVIDDLHTDIKSYLKKQMECQSLLPEKYVQWEVFNRIMREMKDETAEFRRELKEDRRERWKDFDSHTHDQHSGVVILPLARTKP